MKNELINDFLLKSSEKQKKVQEKIYFPNFYSLKLFISFSHLMFSLHL